jgi:hypothetical protein
MLKAVSATRPSGYLKKALRFMPVPGASKASGEDLETDIVLTLALEERKILAFANTQKWEEIAPEVHHSSEPNSSP